MFIAAVLEIFCNVAAGFAGAAAFGDLRSAIDAVARRGVVGLTPRQWWNRHPPFSSELRFRADRNPIVMCQRYAKGAFAAVASCKPQQGIRIQHSNSRCAADSQSVVLPQ